MLFAMMRTLVIRMLKIECVVNNEDVGKLKNA